MKQTFIMNKNNINGWRKYLIIDTDKKTYTVGTTTGSTEEYYKSDLVFKVPSIRPIETELKEKHFTKLEGY